ncbi:MAG TPA: hypothetical protein PK358_08250 [Spirochaetota bacterium]|nr:hypothetical protein [Spirochaetota bacterium]HPJ34809.1 hypothetical protein [Spirochaetota bacterium]
MKEKYNIINLIIAVIFTILGITVPMLFHLFGLGSIFLPMYIPLAIGSYLMDKPDALIAGLLTPLISAVLTGMPPFYPPVAFIMMMQLPVFCFTISFISRINSNYYVALIPAILLDRIILAVINYFILPLFALNPLLVTAYDLLKGLPGIIIMLVIVPLTVPQCRKLVAGMNLLPFEEYGENNE